MGRIRVRVIRGELPRAMSYYVRLAVPGHVRRTRSSEEAEDPHWGDTFDLPVRGVKEGAVLHLTLHDSAEADGVQDDVEMNEATLGGAAVPLNDIVQPYAWVERTVPMAGGSVVVAVFGADTEDNDDLESPKPAPSIDKAARAHINKIATSDASPDDHSPAPGHRHSLTEQEVAAEAAARVAAMRAPLEGSPDGEEYSEFDATPGKADDKADEDDDGYGDDFDSPQPGSPQPKDDADKEEKDDDGYGDEDFEDEASEKADEASEKGEPADVSEKDDASEKASEKDEPDAPSEKDEADKVSEKASEMSDKDASEKDGSPAASEKDAASQKASEKASEKAEEASEKDEFEAESEKDAVSQKGSAQNDNGSEKAESAKAESDHESAKPAEKEPEPERSMKDGAASSGKASAPPADSGSESVEAVGGVMEASGKRSATPPEEEPGQPSTLEDLEAAADEAEAAAVAAEANADEAEAEMHAEVDASFQQDAADGAGGNDDGAEEDEYGDDDYEASDHGHPEEPKEEGDQDPRPEAPESKTPEESRPATQPTPPAEAPLEKAPEPEPEHEAEGGDDVGSVDAPSDDFEGSSSAASAAEEEPAPPQHRPAPPTAEQQVRQPAPPTAPPPKAKRATAVAKPPARASPKKPTKAPAQRSPKKPAPPRDDSWESGSDGEHATPSGPRLHLRVVAARGLPPDASQRVFVRAGVTQGAPAEESCFTNGVHETQDGRAIARRSFGDGSSTELAFSSDFRMAVPEPAKDSLVVQLRDRAGTLLGHASVALAGLRQRAWLYRWLRMADGAAVRVGLFGSDLGTEERTASEAPTEQHDHDPQTIVASHGGDSVTVDVDAAFMRACEHLAISPEKLRARPPSEFMRRGEPEAVGRRRYDLFQASRLKWLYAVVAERERILAQADQKPLAKTAPTPRPPPPRTNGEKPYATPAFAVPPKAKTLTPRPPAAHGDDMLLALASHQRDVLRRQRQRQRHAQNIKERQEAARQEAIAQQSEASRERGAQSVTNRAQVLSIQQTLARRREERDNANAEARREREAEERKMDELKMRVLARDIEVAAARKQHRLDAMAEPNTARRVTAAEQRRKLWDDSQRDAALQQCAKADQGAARGEEQRQRRAQEAKAARQQRDATTVEVQRRGAEFAGAKQAAVEVVATRRAEMSIAYQEALAKANEERAQETARRLKVASGRRDEQEAAYFDRVTSLLDQKTKSFEERDARRSVDTALKRENAKARAEDLATAKAMAEARRERVAQARLLEYQDRQARAEARVEMVHAIRASAYEKTDPPMSV